MEDRELILNALHRARDQQFADMLTLAIGLAAETHPAELREALGKVFDTRAVEDMARRSMLVVSDAQRMAREARELLWQVTHDIEAIEERLDALSAAVDRKAQPTQQRAVK